MTVGRRFHPVGLSFSILKLFENEIKCIIK